MPSPAPSELPPDLLEAVAALLELPVAARGAALAALQAAHPAHAAALPEFLRWLTGSDRLLEAAPTASPPEPVFAGYRVLRRLGEGAFGIVYLCEQSAPIQRQVAIKLLRPGAGDRGTLARFDAERRFLARLGHPAIAQIFDTGLLPDGRPWFVMEYVPGVPFTDYCDRGQLTIGQRLRLFVRLCQGVQHAHDQGIVHRDLKPANVLVVDVDGEAQPKIIDFGVARALAPVAADGGPRTETGRIVGTPGYMSPEQMAGDLAAVDARSDVFSLGVMLYELLTGELPWGKRLGGTDSEPPRPSSRIAAATARGTTVAQQRASQPRRLAAMLRGDLDWIVLQALAREPERRYATASELGADVARHLRGATVSAGPPALAYRLRKFARRHRVALAMGFVMLLILAGGAWQAIAYRTTASDRTRDAEAAVAGLLAQANSRQLVGKTAYNAWRRSLSQQALDLYDRFLRARPDDAAARRGRVAALTTLSMLHAQLAEFALAERIAREAVAEAESLGAAPAADPAAVARWASAERCLGRALLQQARGDEARASFTHAVALLERASAAGPAAADQLVPALLDLYTVVDSGREPARAAALLQQAADLQGALVAAHPEQVQHRDTVVHIALLRSAAAAMAGDLGAASALLAPVVGWLDEGHGLQPGTALAVHALLTRLALSGGERAAARDRCDRALAIGRDWLQREPEAPQPFARLLELLDLECDLHADDEASDSRRRPLRERLALAEQRLDRFPEDALAVHPFVDSARRLAEELLSTRRRADLVGIEPALQRACGQLARLPSTLDAVSRATDALFVRGTAGLVADGLGSPDADAIWEAAAAVLEVDGLAWPDDPGTTARRLLYGTRIVARRLAAGRVPAAQGVLARTVALCDRVPGGERIAIEVAHVQVLAAARAGDLAAAAQHLDALLAGAPDWYALTLASRAAFAIWRAVDPQRPADAAAWRERARTLGERAVAACRSAPAGVQDDPGAALACRQCQLVVALGNRARGDAALAEVLAALADQRAAVHADLWDEPLYREGLAAAGR